MGGSSARLRDRLPPGALALARRGRQVALRASHLRGHSHCPLCESSVRRFLSHGIDSRPDARCPVCGCLERHRLAWLVLEERLDAERGQTRLLHFAPESILSRRLTQRKDLHHITADLSSPEAMLRADITRLPHADASFDAVYCSHVLEHVSDDGAALVEVNRILRRAGWAIFQVPIVGDRTYEDLSVSDADERLRRFGHPDHVRVYGLDFEERLRDGGFDVHAVAAADIASAYELDRFGLGDEMLFLCRKS